MEEKYDEQNMINAAVIHEVTEQVKAGRHLSEEGVVLETYILIADGEEK